MGRVLQLEQREAKDLPTLRDGSFSSVEKLYFSRERVKDSIRPYKSDDTTWTLGPHTLIKLREKKSPKPTPKKSTPKKRAADTAGLDGYDSDGNDLMEGAPPPSIFDNANASQDSDGGTMRERRDGRPVRASTKPQRFDEIQQMQASNSRKKRMKAAASTKDVSGGDAALKKRLKEMRIELKETQAELNASKATCDDLQIQLEEKGQAKSAERKKVRELKVALIRSEAVHKSELEGIKKEHAKKIDALMARIGELEGRKDLEADPSSFLI